MLTRCHFVVVLVDFHAHALHRREHFATHVLCVVCWWYWEVAAFDTRAVTHVAHFIFCVCVPSRIDCVYLERYFVHCDLVTYVVENEEFSFWAEVGHVTDA